VGVSDPVARLVDSAPRLNAKLDRSVHSGRLTALLREAVITGELPSGTPLVEAKLAQQLGVSRGPVRSALAVLEQDGLAFTPPNGRMVVRGFGPEDLADLFRVRLQLETLAVKWGMDARNSPAPIGHALEAMTVEGSATEKLVELDIAFHRAILEFSGSRSLLQAWGVFAGLLQIIVTVGNRELREQDPRSDYDRIMSHHRPLYEAIKARRYRESERLLREQFAVTSSMITLAKRTP
jgi:GntR family transcriptional regulator, gluconate operon transcriptional repressor